MQYINSQKERVESHIFLARAADLPGRAKLYTFKLPVTIAIPANLHINFAIILDYC